MTDKEDDAAPKWVCPKCGSDEGVDICDTLYQYFQANITPEGDHVEYVADPGEINWEGEFQAVRCLNCREEIDTTQLQPPRGIPMLTKKDYQLIAEAFRVDGGDERNDPDDMATRYRIANRLADTFRQQNAGFNKTKFMAACGLPKLED